MKITFEKYREQISAARVSPESLYFMIRYEPATTCEVAKVTSIWIKHDSYDVVEYLRFGKPKSLAITNNTKELVLWDNLDELIQEHFLDLL